MPIVKRILLVKKRSDLSTEQFRARYEDGHVPLLNRLLPMEKTLYYKRNYVEPGKVYPEGTQLDYDSITEFAWPDEENYRAFVKIRFQPDIAEQITQDEDAFIESIRFITVLECNQSADA